MRVFFPHLLFFPFPLLNQSTLKTVSFHLYIALKEVKVPSYQVRTVELYLKIFLSK